MARDSDSDSYSDDFSSISSEELPSRKATTKAAKKAASSAAGAANTLADDIARLLGTAATTTTTTSRTTTAAAATTAAATRATPAREAAASPKSALAPLDATSSAASTNDVVVTVVGPGRGAEFQLRFDDKVQVLRKCVEEEVASGEGGPDMPLPSPKSLRKTSAASLPPQQQPQTWGAMGDGVGMSIEGYRLLCGGVELKDELMTLREAGVTAGGTVVLESLLRGDPKDDLRKDGVALAYVVLAGLVVASTGAAASRPARLIVSLFRRRVARRRLETRAFLQTIGALQEALHQPPALPIPSGLPPASVEATAATMEETPLAVLQSVFVRAKTGRLPSRGEFAAVAAHVRSRLCSEDSTRRSGGGGGDLGLPRVCFVEVGNGGVVVVGDVRGSLEMLSSVLSLQHTTEETVLLFNGGFGSPCESGAAVMLCLAILSCLAPRHVLLTRGCQEAAGHVALNAFAPHYGSELARVFVEYFRGLPTAYVLDGDVAVLHSGLPVRPYLLSTRAGTTLAPDEDEAAHTAATHAFLRNEPIEVFQHLSARPSLPPAACGGEYFTRAATTRFLADNGLSAVVRSHSLPHKVPPASRAHLAVPNATGYAVSHGGVVHTVWSAAEHVPGVGASFVFVRRTGAGRGALSLQPVLLQRGAELDLDRLVVCLPTTPPPATAGAAAAASAASGGGPSKEEEAGAEEADNSADKKQRWCVGDDVLVRDSDREEWKPGVVSGLRDGGAPVVRVGGLGRGCGWAHVKAAGPPRASSGGDGGGDRRRRFAVGDAVRVRDGAGEDWRDGVVTELRDDSPVVRLDGQRKAFLWGMCERRASVSDEPAAKKKAAAAEDSKALSSAPTAMKPACAPRAVWKRVRETALEMLCGQLCRACLLPVREDGGAGLSRGDWVASASRGVAGFVPWRTVWCDVLGRVAPPQQLVLASAAAAAATSGRAGGGGVSGFRLPVSPVSVLAYQTRLERHWGTLWGERVHALLRCVAEPLLRGGEKAAGSRQRRPCCATEFAVRLASAAAHVPLRCVFAYAAYCADAGLLNAPSAADCGAAQEAAAAATSSRRKPPGLSHALFLLWTMSVTKAAAYRTLLQNLEAASAGVRQPSDADWFGPAEFVRYCREHAPGVQEGAAASVGAAAAVCPFTAAADLLVTQRPSGAVVDRASVESFVAEVDSLLTRSPQDASRLFNALRSGDASETLLHTVLAGGVSEAGEVTMDGFLAAYAAAFPSAGDEGEAGAGASYVDAVRVWKLIEAAAAQQPSEGPSQQQAPGGSCVRNSVVPCEVFLSMFDAGSGGLRFASPTLFRPEWCLSAAPAAARAAACGGLAAAAVAALTHRRRHVAEGLALQAEGCSQKHAEKEARAVDASYAAIAVRRGTALAAWEQPAGVSLGPLTCEHKGTGGKAAVGDPAQGRPRAVFCVERGGHGGGDGGDAAERVSEQGAEGASASAAAAVVPPHGKRAVLRFAAASGDDAVRFESSESGGCVVEEPARASLDAFAFDKARLLVSAGSPCTVILSQTGKPGRRTVALPGAPTPLTSALRLWLFLDAWSAFFGGKHGRRGGTAPSHLHSPDPAPARHNISSQFCTPCGLLVTCPTKRRTPPLDLPLTMVREALHAATVVLVHRYGSLRGAVEALGSVEELLSVVREMTVPQPTGDAITRVFPAGTCLAEALDLLALSEAADGFRRKTAASGAKQTTRTLARSDSNSGVAAADERKYSKSVHSLAYTVEEDDIGLLEEAVDQAVRRCFAPGVPDTATHVVVADEPGKGEGILLSLDGPKKNASVRFSKDNSGIVSIEWERLCIVRTAEKQRVLNELGHVMFQRTCLGLAQRKRTFTLGNGAKATPLHFACLALRPHVVKWLLAHGASPNVSCTGDAGLTVTPAHLCRVNNKACLEAATKHTQDELELQRSTTALKNAEATATKEVTETQTDLTAASKAAAAAKASGAAEARKKVASLEAQLKANEEAERKCAAATEEGESAHQAAAKRASDSKAAAALYLSLVRELDASLHGGPGGKRKRHAKLQPAFELKDGVRGLRGAALDSILKAIKAGQTKEVNLGGVHLTEADATALFDALAQAEAAVVDVNLRRCGLTAAAGAHLARALATNRSVERLYLWGNELRESALSLVEAAVSHPLLAVLDLTCTGMNQAECDKAVAAAQSTYDCWETEVEEGTGTTPLRERPLEVMVDAVCLSTAGGLRSVMKPLTASEVKDAEEAAKAEEEESKKRALDKDVKASASPTSSLGDRTLKEEESMRQLEMEKLQAEKEEEEEVAEKELAKKLSSRNLRRADDYDDDVY